MVVGVGVEDRVGPLFSVGSSCTVLCVCGSPCLLIPLDNNDKFGIAIVNFFVCLPPLYRSPSPSLDLSTSPSLGLGSPSAGGRVQSEWTFGWCALDCGGAAYQPRSCH
jgi:hypothetical protein